MENNKCNCSSECECGCQEGKKCTCNDEKCFCECHDKKESKN